LEKEISVFAIINIVTYGLYYYDKQQARSSGWRISEKTLMMGSLLGGWPAALYAIEDIRHKSSKRSFQIMHWIVIATNLVGMSYLFFFS